MLHPYCFFFQQAVYFRYHERGAVRLVRLILCKVSGGGHFGRTSLRLNWGQNNLSQVSDEAGGEAYDLGVVATPSFNPYFDDISKRLGQQYLLTFLAKPETKAGMRSIKLSTEVPNAELVGAARAYAPASSSR